MNAWRLSTRLTAGVAVLLWSTASVWSTPTAASPVLPTLPTSKSSALRIAALAPSLTELVYAAGGGDKLVAVSAYSDYPAEAKRLPVVADYAGVNMEALLALKPTLVLAWTNGTKAADVVRLRELGIAVEDVSVARLADVTRVLAQVGRLVGNEAFAAMAATRLHARTEVLRQRYLSKPRIDVFIEIGRTPLMTVNGAHFISDLVTLCGGQNVFADAASLVFQPSRETMLLRNPAVVLRGASRTTIQQNDDIYKGTKAYANKRMLTANADHLLRPGPRLIDAAEEVCSALDGVR